MQYTHDYPAAHALGITAARLAYNKSLPATLPGPLTEEGAAGEPLPNPALIDTDDAYLAFVFSNAISHWATMYDSAWRIPTGKWMQRWSVEEKRAIRQLGAQSAQVQGWLDELDANEHVNLTHASVVVGVPAVCAGLEQLGVIAEGQAASRAAAVVALDV